MEPAEFTAWIRDNPSVAAMRATFQSQRSIKLLLLRAFIRVTNSIVSKWLSPSTTPGSFYIGSGFRGVRAPRFQLPVVGVNPISLREFLYGINQEGFVWHGLIQEMCVDTSGVDCSRWTELTEYGSIEHYIKERGTHATSMVAVLHASMDQNVGKRIKGQPTFAWQTNRLKLKTLITEWSTAVTDDDKRIKEDAIGARLHIMLKSAQARGVDLVTVDPITTIAEDLLLMRDNLQAIFTNFMPPDESANVVTESIAVDEPSCTNSDDTSIDFTPPVEPECAASVSSVVIQSVAHTTNHCTEYSELVLTSGDASVADRVPPIEVESTTSASSTVTQSDAYDANNRTDSVKCTSHMEIDDMIENQTGDLTSDVLETVRDDEPLEPVSADEVRRPFGDMNIRDEKMLSPALFGELFRDCNRRINVRWVKDASEFEELPFVKEWFQFNIKTLDKELKRQEKHMATARLFVTDTGLAVYRIVHPMVWGALLYHYRWATDVEMALF